LINTSPIHHAVGNLLRN